MNLRTERATDDRPEAGAPGVRSRRHRIDVTDLHAAAVDEYVRDRVHTDRVSLEHRGARTYLLVER